MALQDPMKRNLLKAVALGAKAHGALYRPLNISHRVMSSFLMTALRHDEKEAVGLYLYNEGKSYRDYGLLPWETMWFGERLPAAGAHILIGACGAGREVENLLGLGYEVTCFDGSASMVEECTRRAPKATVFRSTFREYTRDARGRNEVFDAALIGWGSVGHVYAKSDLEALVKALDSVCPEGPILMSYPAPPKNQPPIGRGKAEELGRQLGARFCSVLGRAPTEHPYEAFTLTEGFLRSVPLDELRHIADSVDRKIIADNFGYPTVTLAR